MPSYCIICEFKWTKDSKTSFHKFNFDREEILSKWTEFVRKTKNQPNWSPSRWSSLCNKHFQPSDFKVQKGVLRKHLKPDAIPSIIEPEIPPEGETLTLPVPPPSITTAPPPSNLFDSSTNGSQCRLCARIIISGNEFGTGGGGGVSLFNCPTLREWTDKYLSHLNILPDDGLTKSVCASCFHCLEEFNRFSENAVKSQTSLLCIGFSSLDDHRFMARTSFEMTRTMKIKQEPMVSIKEENHVLNPPGAPQPTCSAEQAEDFQNNLSSLLSDFCHGLDTHPHILEITDLTNDFINYPNINLTDDPDPAGRNVDDEINIKPNIHQNLSNSPFLLHPPGPLKQEGAIDCDDVDSLFPTLITNEHSYCKYGIPLLMERVKMEQKEEPPPAVIPPGTMVSIPKIYIIDNALIKHKCDLCGGLYETKSLLRDHQRRIHDRFLCPRCNIRCPNFSSFYFHKLNCCYRRGYLTATRRYWECKDCHSTFKLRLSWENHAKRNICRSVLKIREAGRENGKNAKQARGNNQQLTCGICNKIFVRRSNLNQHQLTHSQLRAFACQTCDKVFKRSCGLIAHQKSFHFQLRPFKCDICARAFALKADMRRCKHIIGRRRPMRSGVGHAKQQQQQQRLIVRQMPRAAGAAVKVLPAKSSSSSSSSGIDIAGDCILSPCKLGLLE